MLPKVAGVGNYRLPEVAKIDKFMLPEVAKIGNFWHCNCFRKLPEVETFLCKKLPKLANSRKSNCFQNWPCDVPDRVILTSMLYYILWHSIKISSSILLWSQVSHLI